VVVAVEPPSELEELNEDELASSEDELVVVAVKPPSAADELDSLDELDELDELDSLDSLDELDELDELSALDELVSELDDELLETELAAVAPNTALNCSSVTQVSPTQILFALTAPFSNDIPNIVLNLSKIQANKLSVPVPLEAATLACKSLTFKFISCIAFTKTEVSFG